MENSSKFPATNLNHSQKIKDGIDMELQYYSKLLPLYVKSLTKHQRTIVMWIDRLVSPENNTKMLQDLRNRYLMLLALSTVTGIIPELFQNPPADVLVKLNQIRRPTPVKLSWETKMDKDWEDVRKSAKRKYTCGAHPNNSCPKDSASESAGIFLDNQFKFLLSLSKAVMNLHQESDRLKGTKWIQQLCTIGPEFCIVTKGIRNDYMISLIGYVTFNMLRGPFIKYPPKTLQPLNKAMELYNKNQLPLTDPTHPIFSEITSELPDLTEGAFAVIAITKDVILGNIQ